MLSRKFHIHRHIFWCYFISDQVDYFDYVVWQPRSVIATFIVLLVNCFYSCMHYRTHICIGIHTHRIYAHALLHTHTHTHAPTSPYPTFRYILEHTKRVSCISCNAAQKMKSTPTFRLKPTSTS